MKIKIFKTAACAALLFVCFLPARPTYAASTPDRIQQQSLDIHDEDLALTVLGLGLRISESPYIDKDDDIWPVPLLVARYKNFFVDGRKLGYILKQFPQGNFALVGFPRFNGYEQEDSPFLDGMDDRSGSFDGGIRCRWNSCLVSLELTVSSDLLNRHQGQEIGFLVSREFYRGFLKPRLGVNWLSEDTVDYYYGVKGGEAKAGRPAYEGGPAVNWTAGLQMSLPVKGAWILFTDVQFEKLGADIEDSPLVDKQDLWATSVGLVYRF